MQKKKLFGILSLTEKGLFVLGPVNYKTKTRVREFYKKDKITSYLYYTKLTETNFFKILQGYHIIFIKEDEIESLVSFFTSENYILELTKKESAYYRFTVKHAKNKTTRKSFKILDRYLDEQTAYKIVNYQQYKNDRNVIYYAGLLLLRVYLYGKIPNLYFEIKNSSSLSGLIYNAYLKNYKPKTVYDNNAIDFNWITQDFELLTQSQDNKIRPSYFGGRTDVFIHTKKTGFNNAFVVDCNNFYPYLMDKELPFGKMVTYSVRNLTNEQLQEKIKTSYGFAKIKFICPKSLKIPLLLLKKANLQNDSSRNFAPVGGPYTGVYYAEEIRKAISIGYTIEILEFYEFKKAKIFEEFLSVFARTELTNNIEKSFFKLCVNRLYGYFGINYYSEQGLRQYQSMNETDWTTDTSFFEVIGESYFFEKEKKVLKKGNVAISSAITAEGRLHLYDLMIKYQEDLIYVDTDSLFLRKNLSVDKLGLNPGLFKEVYPGEVILDFLIISSKFYSIKFKSKKELLVVKGYNEEDLLWNFDMLKKKFIFAIENNLNFLELLEKKTNSTLIFKLDLIKRKTVIINDYIVTEPLAN